MAPKVQAPCDFGREYINVPEHSNLKLKLKTGGEYLVNSVIMSYNSPEIKRLTTELHQTSLEMDDFDDDAVYCFVDALYSGELEMINKDIFTDVYKMGRVFKVSWLLSKCTDYFESLVASRGIVDESMIEKNFDHSLSKFLFTIAGKIQEFLKERIFMDILIKSLKEKEDKCEFIKRLVGGTKLDELSKSMAEEILHIVGEKSDMLMKGLVKSLRDNPFDGSLSEALKYMLTNVDLAFCYQKSQETYDEFFDLLENVKSLTREDLKFINRIHRQCMKKVTGVPLTDPRQLGIEKQSVKSNRVHDFKKYHKLRCRVTGRGSQMVEGIRIFSDLNFGFQLQNNIAKIGYNEPSLVQKYVLPIVCQGRDLLVCAPAGSGKTTAFVLPMIDIINTRGPSSSMFSVTQTPEVIVITPTDERALKIHKETSKFSCFTMAMCKTQLALDEAELQYQKSCIRKGCNILIGTPFRLMQFVTGGDISLQNIKLLVLDEADKMLSMALIPKVRFFTGAPGMPSKQNRQTLLFSSTFQGELEELARNILKPEHLLLTLDKVTLASPQSDVTQQVLRVEEQHKVGELLEVLSQIKQGSKAQIFVQTNQRAEFLVSYLSQVGGYDVRSLVHGKDEHLEHEMTVNDFSTDTCSILVVISAALSTQEIVGVTHVIHLDLPVDIYEIDEYINRIRPTEQAGDTKTSTISFLDPQRNIDMAFMLVKILANAQQDVPNWLEDIAARAVGTDGWRI
jgi:probable ATP-dependent RNA helicase DDX4